MSVVWTTIKKYFWLALIVVVPIFILIFKGFFAKGDALKPGQLLPDVPQGLKDRAEKAEEEALVTRAVVKVKTETKKAELATISKIDDGAERRKKLAEFLDTV